MSQEFVQLANANHLAATGQEISAQVQRFMQANLMKSAERPASPEQLHGIADASQKLGVADDSSQITNALQASLWRAHNSPDRADLLEQFTKATEATYTQQQSPALKIDSTLQALGQDDVAISR
jgi:uncharacterized protein with beta-barrel porin domain